MGKNDEQEKALIASFAQSYGFDATEEGFLHDKEENRPYLFIGRGVALEDHDEDMFFEGDEGELRVTCVGGEEHGNLQPAWYFHPDGMEASARVHDVGTIELS